MNALPSEFHIPEGPMLPFSPAGLGRLDVEPPILTPATTYDLGRLEVEDWDEIHKIIQGVFGDMADRVRRHYPSIRSRGGRSSGCSFPLFTYRTFDLGGDQEIDPVIVGITFERAPSEGFFVVRGDIGGEESGRIDFEVPEKEAVNSRQSLIPTALKTALVLGDQWLLVAESVDARHQPPDY
jgi:hypothetical protein